MIYEKDLIVKDCNNGIGLCTLWTPKELYKDQDVRVIGNLYSEYGAGILIRNALELGLTRIVVVGRDNPNKARAVKDKFILRMLDPDAVKLNQAQLDYFYDNVHVLDFTFIGVRDQDGIATRLQDFATDAKYDTITIPLVEVDIESFSTSRSGHLIRGESIGDVYRDLLREIRLFGEKTQPDSEGHYRQELWQLVACMSAPDWKSTPNCSENEVATYGEELWNGHEPEDLSYRYGHLMRVTYGDQVEALIVAIAHKPETYRTIISLWGQDSITMEHPPCLITVHPRIRNGVLDMMAYIRTNDMFNGWPMNVGGLRYWQERFAHELLSRKVVDSLELGDLTVISGSAHIYDRDISAIDGYLQVYVNRRIVADPKGNWILELEDDLYVAVLYGVDGLLKRFACKSKIKLRRELIPYISSVGHALYLGGEIEKL